MSREHRIPLIWKVVSNGVSLYSIAAGLIGILGYLLKSQECIDENDFGHTVIPGVPIRAQRRPMGKTQ